METRQQFGGYALFKRLASDSLGETWRAGRMGPEGVDRVVLLRLWNGDGVDGDRFAECLAERAAVQQILKSPHLAEGVDLGSEEGTPYLAYEYVSGKSLHDLLRETRERPFPIPSEHALFIAERMAMGLAAAYDQRFLDRRLVHGLLAPALVWLSNEGEVRILGCEAGPAYATLAPEALGANDLAPYLSPEVAAGGTANSAADVYSLGAMLFELLTGRPMPASTDDLSALLAEARLSTDDEPIPPPLRELLRLSLSPVSDRIASVDRWCQALSRLILDGDYNPTTFNLAFFMHTLFRGDINRETEEVEIERTSEFRLAPAAAAPAAGESSGADSPPVGDEGDARIGGPQALLEELGAADETEEAPPAPGRPTVAGVGKAARDTGGRSRALVVAAVVFALALVGAGAYYWFKVRTPGSATAGTADLEAGGPPLPAVTVTTSASGETTATGELVAEPGTESAIDDATVEAAIEVDYPEPPETPDEIQATIRQLVAERTGRMEQSLKAEYDSKLDVLRGQLEEARQRSAEGEAEDAAERAAITGERAPDAKGADTGNDAKATTSPGRGAPSSTPGAAANQGRKTPSQPEAGAGEGSPTTADGTRAAEPTPPPAPAQQVEARRGDLVRPGPGVSPPKLTRQPQALYPLAARKFARTATVKVRLLVDENGRPIEVEQVSEAAGFGFDEAAIKAARSSRWAPGRKDGVEVKMWVDLTIVFQP